MVTYIQTCNYIFLVLTQTQVNLLSQAQCIVTIFVQHNMNVKLRSNTPISLLVRVSTHLCVSIGGLFNK